ncbi:MAG: glutathione synthase [Desulfobacterales bacterium]|nr:glutathione synthase [Desulfobacterales bacterium]
MILSYHPFFEADKNIICAGREPDAEDLAAIRAADAVVLPQGCFRSLYAMARQNCANIFPNFDARFKYAGKIGQARLFEETHAPHPETATYRNLDSFYNHPDSFGSQTTRSFPLVFKFDWGGEGNHVFLINSSDELDRVLQTAADFEKGGRSGFLLQNYIPDGNRSVRVVVVGQTFLSYWRIQNSTESFGSSLAQGAVIDADADPDLQQLAVAAVKAFCNQTGINLAGFDILFAAEPRPTEPLFLEINYYFGRRGLGGSENLYKLLNTELLNWVNRLGLTLQHR